MRSPFTVVRDLVSDAREKVVTAARFSHQTGYLWEVRPGAVGELFRALVTGAQNPATAYRIAAKNHPDKVALVHGERRIPFGDLDRLIDSAAHGLHTAGVRRGHSVLLAMKNCPEFVIASAAAGRLRASAVAVSWRSTPRELAYLANHSKARLVVCDPDVFRTLEAARADLSEELLSRVFVVGGAGQGAPFERLLSHEDRGPFVDAAPGEDAAVVIYTSGTTGKPKGAVRKFPRSAANAAFRFLCEVPLRVEDVHLVACPMYHSTAYAFMTFSHIMGNTVVLMDEFTPEGFLAQVERYKVSTTAVVPTMLHRLMQLPDAVRRRYDAHTLRIVFSGGAHLPPTVATAFMDAFGDTVYNFYGATETGLVTLASPRDLRSAPGTIGRAVPGNEIRLLGESGAPVPAGQVGELFVKNDLLVSGYYDDDAATRGSMREGFFSVGDLARVDDHGRYFLEGRKRDMIVTGGVNVYPAEVEHALMGHPGVSEVAVLGRKDEEWGERVVAFVVPAGDVTEGELVAFAKERLSGPKRPKEYHFVPALPRNPTGKVVKRELEGRLEPRTA